MQRELSGVEENKYRLTINPPTEKNQAKRYMDEKQITRRIIESTGAIAIQADISALER